MFLRMLGKYGPRSVETARLCRLTWVDTFRNALSLLFFFFFQSMVVLFYTTDPKYTCILIIYVYTKEYKTDLSSVIGKRGIVVFSYPPNISYQVSYQLMNPYRLKTC